MNARIRTITVAVAIIALSILVLWFTMTAIDPLGWKALGGSEPTVNPKAQSGILGYLQGTATAEAEETPEPEAKLPGMKAQPQQSFDQWWFEMRFPNWVSA